jgi:hypothetical protein
MFGLHGSAYLSAVMDLYNNEMWHWELSQRSNLYVVIGDTSECGASEKLTYGLYSVLQRKALPKQTGLPLPVEFREKPPLNLVLPLSSRQMKKAMLGASIFNRCALFEFGLKASVVVIVIFHGLSNLYF